MKARYRLPTILLAGCMAAALTASHAAAQTTALRLGTSSSGSIFYTLGVGLSSMLTKHAKIAATAEPVGGSTANMFAIGADRVDIAIGNALAAYDAVHGNKPFKKKIELGLIAQGAPNLRQLIVRVGSGIEKPEDLVGKTLIGRRPALPELELITNAMLRAYKIDPGKVRIVSTTNTPEAVDAIKSGTVDAVLMPGSAGASYLQQLAHDGQIRFINIPDDKMQEIAKHLPPAVAIAKLPAKTYAGQDQAVNIFGLASYLVAASRLSEDTVYAVTKTLFDNIKEFHTFHGTAREWTLEESLTDPKVPYHPGAVRYFKERKVWTPQLEALQAKLSKGG
jgi:uncharacterized protein